MLSSDAIGGRFIVGRNRLSFKAGEAIAFARGKSYDIPGMPACLVEFDDLHIGELDLTVAEQKAVRGGLDTKRWFKGIMANLLSLRQGQHLIYVVDALDCWRSFLFCDPLP